MVDFRNPIACEDGNFPAANTAPKKMHVNVEDLNNVEGLSVEEGE